MHKEYGKNADIISKATGIYGRQGRSVHPDSLNPGKNKYRARVEELRRKYTRQRKREIEKVKSAAEMERQ